MMNDVGPCSKCGVSIKSVTNIESGRTLTLQRVESVYKVDMYGAVRVDKLGEIWMSHFEVCGFANMDGVEIGPFVAGSEEEHG